MRAFLAYLAALAVACLSAGGSWGAPALFISSASNVAQKMNTPPARALVAGHFAGKAQLVALTHDCRDPDGHPVAGTRCPVLRDGRQLWANATAPRYATAAPLPPDVITLQPGTVTDLASIPRLVSNVYPPDGPWAIAALFHDLCYQTKGSFAWRGRPAHTRATPYTRAECDELLRQAMAALGVGAFQRVTIFEAVRLGGAQGWGR